MRTTLILAAMLTSGLASAAKDRDDEPQGAAAYFETSGHCIACHSNLTTSSGEDISIGYSWRASMMANSGRDPYWHAGVRREVTDHPIAQAAIEDECSTCHMPMARYAAHQEGGMGHVFENIPGMATGADAEFAQDGVSCSVCHQVKEDNFGTRASFVGGFEIAAAVPGQTRTEYGPHDVDTGRQSVMQSSSGLMPDASSHLGRAELCATCHTLITHALDENGREIAEFPEQVPYQEWSNSIYRDTETCQSCHMPVVEEEVPISSTLGQPRPNFYRHVFRGSNAFMLGILNKNRGALGVKALPQELEAGMRLTRDFLASSTARIAIESPRRAAGALQFDVTIESMVGHKLPTAYPARRAWLHVQVLDSAGRVLFESGAVRPDGSIDGNDNDADASRFEPHYGTIESPDQVQIYESIMIDARSGVTTGLLNAVTYAKDNRLLPKGFDKQGADEQVAVHGAAVDDADFTAGGDRVSYRLSGLAGAAEIRVEMRYQAIGYRWAHNLENYDAFETNRFVGYYEESAHGSAELLATAVARIGN